MKPALLTIVIFAVIIGIAVYLLNKVPDDNLLYDARRKCAVTNGQVIWNDEYKVYQCR